MIIQRGNDRLIIPRHVHTDASNAAKAPKVQSAVTDTFDALASDKKITDFGLTPQITDRKPLIQIPRAEFPVSNNIILPTDPNATLRSQRKRATLVIRKVWLNGTKRKWSFEWNGVPISARVVDLDFLKRLSERDYLIGSGDALDVQLDYTQLYEPTFGIFVNDQNSFVISKVYRVIENLPHPRLP